MLGNKSNDFKDKFNLLNSQPLSQEITWSSSESSDYESSTVPLHTTSAKKVHLRKRKRKNKIPKNISNLDFTILDTKNTSMSPPKCSKTENNSSSPILLSQYFPPLASPTLKTKQKKVVKSPVIAVKSLKADNSMSKRKLFYGRGVCLSSNIGNKIERSPSPVIMCSQINMIDKDSMSKSFCSNNNRSLSYEHVNKKLRTDIATNSLYEDVETKENKTNMLNKVQSYFESNFSSQSLSQHSILETQTQRDSSSNSNVDIEFTISLTQVPSSNKVSFESIKSKTKEPIDSDNSFDKSKKAKYKKDGLAYKLNAALKKQNASLSMWQHERYLAENSNFVIPKEDCKLFHLKNVKKEFGCFLLEVADVNDEICFILLNNVNVKNCNLANDTVFKLFEPYTILNVDNNKIIVNICKYDCISVKNDLST